MMMTMIIHSREKETDDTVVGSFHSHSQEVSAAVDLVEEAVAVEALAVSAEAGALAEVELPVDGNENKIYSKTQIFCLGFSFLMN